jgi:hypothetical protein
VLLLNIWVFLFGALLMITGKITERNTGSGKIERRNPRHLDEDEKGKHRMPTPGGDQELSLISEPGLYRAAALRRALKKHEPMRPSAGAVAPGLNCANRYSTGRTPKGSNLFLCPVPFLSADRRQR